MLPEPQTILATIDQFTDGHLIHSVDALVALGYPRDFVAPLAETFTDDPDEPQKTLRDEATGKRLEHLHGVHDLDLLHALALALGADLSEVCAFGSGTRARQYALAIRESLTK